MKILAPEKDTHLLDKLNKTQLITLFLQTLIDRLHVIALEHQRKRQPVSLAEHVSSMFYTENKNEIQLNNAEKQKPY